MFANYPDILSVNDIRHALGIGRTKAYELIRSGEIRSIRIGSTIRIPKKSLLDYLETAFYNQNEVDSCLNTKEAV